MNCLMIKLEVVIGSDIDEAVDQACLIAHKLDLHHLKFEANDQTFLCYSDGYAVKWNSHNMMSTEIRAGLNQPWISHSKKQTTMRQIHMSEWTTGRCPSCKRQIQIEDGCIPECDFCGWTADDPQEIEEEEEEEED